MLRPSTSWALLPHLQTLLCLTNEGSWGQMCPWIGVVTFPLPTKQAVGEFQGVLTPPQNSGER